MVAKIVHYFFLTCLKATEFVEKKLYYKLSWKEKIQLKVHLRVCKTCSKYEKQSSLLDKMMAAPSRTTISSEEMLMLKQQIAQKLEQKDRE